MHEEIKSLVGQFYEVSNGSWRLKTNRTIKTTEQIENNISSILSSSKKYALMAELSGLSEWLADEIIEAQAQAQSSAVDITPEKYILETLARHDIGIEGRGDRYYKKSMGVEMGLSSDGVLTMLKGDLWEFNRFLPSAKRLKEGDITNKFLQMLLSKGHAVQTELIRSMIHSTRCTDITTQWLTELHAVMVIREPLKVWLMVMKHMMWLVKRHLYGKKVKNDIWVQIMGVLQASGKTYTARECIFHPLKDVYMETELSKIEDIDREVEKFTQYLVVNFDEIALGNSGDPQYKIGKKMLNNLKSILTRDEIITRTYHTQRQEKRTKTFTAFSTANTHLYDVIYDETGMRRFFEFNTDTKVMFDNARVAELKARATDAWVGIDENLDDGYWVKDSEEGRFITNAQESYFPTYSTVKMWAESAKVQAGTLCLDDAYSEYREYCRDTGNSFICSQQSFVCDMRKLYKSLIDNNGTLRINYV